jgi:hypothetical protein
MMVVLLSRWRATLVCTRSHSGNWAKKVRESDESVGKPLEDSERAELERFRVENAGLKRQVEFAKK